MKLNNRFIFGILSLLLAAVIAFVALPTIARQTNGKEEIVRITQPVLKGEQISSENAEVVEVGGYRPSALRCKRSLCYRRPGCRRLYPYQQDQLRTGFVRYGAQQHPFR